MLCSLPPKGEESITDCLTEFQGIIKGERGGKKLQEKVGRSTFVALLLFVGIPLPGTGAWTGTLAASILDMDFKSTTIAVMLGVLLAGVIMMVVSFLGFSLI